MKKILLFILNLIKYVIKQIVFIILSFSILFGIIFYFVSVNLPSEMEKTVEVVPDSYLELSFPDGLREKNNFESIVENIFDNRTTSFYDAVRAIENAKMDNKIKGILINLTTINLPMVYMEEIGKELEEFKKYNKKIYAYGEIITNGNYFLASYADEIVMPPSHSTIVNLSGYYRVIGYYKNLFDKIGVKFDVLHIGDYKTYSEEYIRENMSKERKEELSRVLDYSLNYFVEQISKNRNIDKYKFYNNLINGKYVSKDSLIAKESKLIDGLEYYNQFLVKKGINNIISISKYNKARIERKSKDKIAIIYADGNIDFETSYSNMNSITYSQMEEELKLAEEDKNIKGIVFRVNSPGGLALIAELITERYNNTNKPIYVSIGRVAASGGYYISTVGKKIFINNSSITGSIGVVTRIFNVNELYDKLGIRLEEIKKGKYSDLYSLNNKLTEEERRIIIENQKNTYKEFKNRVEKSRKIDSESLEKIAQGKIWIGKEAVENGLVDGIATLNGTIKIMAKDLGLDNYSIIEIYKKVEDNNLVSRFSKYIKVNNIYDKLNEELKYIESYNKKILLMNEYDI
ncbi:protease-4 [Hypnocyclicus thermotrophus]|uniref:Protease-4 n=1 Tax=Hypnocyclicus thermotrophus TaxID=1627895 RepID=A0AA46E003_9FUSO|nr:signal peptide peptidase SppA [Hypnocyclicus thermotrophus]TDT71826.1 protease-4 [Hypnocyclicus thermotrophus]